MDKHKLTLTSRITKEHLEEFANFDSSLVWDYFPKNTHVLTLHGLKDKVVPVYGSKSLLFCLIVADHASATMPLSTLELSPPEVPEHTNWLS